MNEILKQCPVCSGGLGVKELECASCGTRVIGKFATPGLTAKPEVLDFIKVFIYAEGNIKQCEKILNCSYPKIKNMLKKAKKELGLEEQRPSGGDVLDRLNKGELNVDEALKQLKELK